MLCLLLPPAGVQQSALVVSDGRPALSGGGVTLTYGTLPRAPRRAPPPSSTSSLPRLRLGSSRTPASPQSLYGTLSHCQQLPPSIQHTPHQGATQPRRLDVPPESDWRSETDYRTAPPSSFRTARHPQAPPTAQPHRHAPFCSLCQQFPAELLRPYCPSCSAYVARFHRVS